MTVLAAVGCLSSWQIEHELANSGEEALEILHTAAVAGAPYDIAIVDKQMPNMDGVQLSSKIKTDQSLASTRLILLNAQGRRGDAEKFGTVGIDGYLSKPIEQSVLYNTLLKVAGITPADVRVATRYTSRERPQFNARVLVVEDNITNQAVARGMLEKFSLRIDVASNGEEAVMTLEQLPYDLVFMDCQMPVMDGYQASRCIRDPQSRVNDHTVPIVAMTANAMQGDREKCLAAGMSDHIAKPVDPDKLLQVLNHWLPESSRRKTADGEGTTDISPMADGGDQVNDESNYLVFDQAAFSERMMGDEALMGMVAEAFLADVPQQVELLRQSLDTEDLEAARALAHKIKGASANVGGMALNAVVTTMEQAGKAGKLDTLHQALPQLEQCISALRKQMKGLLT